MRKDGFEEDDILLFNGDFNDAMTKEIYRAWQVKNFGKTNYGRNVIMQIYRNNIKKQHLMNPLFNIYSEFLIERIIMADTRKKASMSQVLTDIKPYITKKFMAAPCVKEQDI